MANFWQQFAKPIIDPFKKPLQPAIEAVKDLIKPISLMPKEPEPVVVAPPKPAQITLGGIWEGIKERGKKIGEAIKGITPKKEEEIIKFEIGEGLTPYGKKIAESKIKELATMAPGIPVKVPFLPKEITLPKGPIEPLIAGFIEWPEELAIRLPIKIKRAFEEVAGKKPLAEEIKIKPGSALWKMGIYEITPYSKQVLDLQEQGWNPFLAALYVTSGAILDVAVAGNILTKGTKGLLSATEKSLSKKLAWDTLGRPTTMAEAKKEYRTLAGMFHPDKPVATANVEMFKRVNDAWQILQKEGLPNMAERSLVPKLRQIGKQALADIRTRIPEEVVAYPGVAGLLPERAGYVPVEAYQPFRPVKAGLSIRPVPMKPVTEAVELEAGEVAKPTAEVAKRIVKYQLPAQYEPKMGKATWKHGQMVWRTLRNTYGETNKYGTDLTQNKGVVTWVIDRLSGGNKKLAPLMKQYEGQRMSYKQYKKLYAMFKSRDYDLDGYRHVMANLKGIEPVVTKIVAPTPAKTMGEMMAKAVPKAPAKLKTADELLKADKIRPKETGIGKGRFWEYRDEKGTFTVAPNKEEAVKRANEALKVKLAEAPKTMAEVLKPETPAVIKAEKGIIPQELQPFVQEARKELLKVKYLYHGTSEEALRGILKEGLTFAKPSIYTKIFKEEPYRAVNLTKNIEDAEFFGNLLSKKAKPTIPPSELRGKEVILRIRTTNLTDPIITKDPRMVDSYLYKGTINPKNIEIRIEGRWQSLEAVKGVKEVKPEARYSPERLKLHQKIINKLKDRKIIDADEIKELLPEYDFLHPELVHAESRHIRTKLIRTKIKSLEGKIDKSVVFNIGVPGAGKTTVLRSASKYYDIIYEATGKTAESIRQNISLLQNKGFKVDMNLVAIPLKQSLKAQAWRRVHKERSISDEIVKNIYPKTYENFFRLKEIADSWKIYDHQTYGKPIKVAQMIDGDLTIFDKALYNEISSAYGQIKPKPSYPSRGAREGRRISGRPQEGIRRREGRITEIKKEAILKSPTLVKEAVFSLKKHPKGKCFQNAIDYMTNHPEDKSLRLVHAKVTGQGAITGIRYDHAWVEKGNLIIDTSRQNQEIPKLIYYSIGNIKELEVRRYTADEMRKKMLETENYGPWEEVKPEITPTPETAELIKRKDALEKLRYANLGDEKITKAIEKLNKQIAEAGKPKTMAEMLKPKAPVAAEEAVPTIQKVTGAMMGKPGFAVFKEGKTISPLFNTQKQAQQWLAETPPMKSVKELLAERAVAPPGKPPQKTVAEMFKPLPGEKEKKFIKTVKEASKTTQELKEALGETYPYYEPITNKESLAKAEKTILANPDEAKKIVLSKEPVSAEKSAIVIKLIKKYEAEKNYESAVELIENYDQQLREAGRYIQAASLWGKLSPEGMVRTAIKVGNKIKKELSPEAKKIILKRMKSVQKMPEGPEKVKATLEVMNYIADQFPPKFGDVFDAFRYQNMLSSPRSWERNIHGNVFGTFVIRPLDLVGEWIYDIIRHPFNPAARDIKLADIGRYHQGAFKTIPEAITAFKEGLRTGKISEKILETGGEKGITMIEMLRREKLPKAVTVIPRFMEAQDRFFSVLIGAGEKARLMKMGITEKEAEAAARTLAEEYLYRERLGTSPKNLPLFSRALDGLGQLALKGRNIPGIGTIWSWFVPFVRTPINIAKFGVERSLLGFIGGKYSKEQIGKALIGTILTGIGAILAMQGKTTWLPPIDQKAKRLFYDSGRKAMSIEIGGKWIPMYYLGPFAIALGLPAAVKYYTTETKEALTEDSVDKIGRIILGSSRIITEQTPVRGISLFLQVLEGDIDYSIPGQMVRTAKQVIPFQAMIAYINTMLDPVYRKSRKWSEALKADLPLLSKDLPLYEKITGEPATRNWTDFFLPYTVGFKKEEFEIEFGKRVKEIQIKYVESEEERKFGEKSKVPSEWKKQRVAGKSQLPSEWRK